MAAELSVAMVMLLVGTGIVAGFINILAGGGSFLTLPALMLLGIPADIANATNRVGVLLQSVEGVRGFNKHRVLATQAIVPIMVPAVAGSLVGALVASYLPTGLLKPVILLTLVGMALLMLLRPSVVVPLPGTQPLSPLQSPAGFAGLFVAGLYGGFIQAGVGFVVLAALTGVLRYDLVRANALKMAATLIFTAVALVVFIARDQILWVPGLLLGLGSVIGARLSVRFAVTVDPRVLRWFLLVAVLGASVAVWFS